MENQGSSICFHRFLELQIASLRIKVWDLLIFDSASPLLYLTLLFSLLLFLSYFFSLTPDSLFLKTSLFISPKVPSVLHHHAVALGSCPKFRILSPDEIMISVWNHTVNSFVVGGNVYLPILGFCFGSLQTFSGQVEKLDIITAAMGHTLATEGGFCTGSARVTDHQRLSSSGYVFSASLPLYLASAAITAIDILEENPGLITKLKKNIAILWKGLSTIQGLSFASSPDSPIVFLRLEKADSVKSELQLKLLQDIANRFSVEV